MATSGEGVRLEEERGGDIAEDADDLSRLRSLYGEGPEADSLRIVDGRQARLNPIRQHHVFAQEEKLRSFFEKRGFVGDRNIDNFCVEIEVSTLEAIHGGGDWRLGRRVWPDEWNQRIVRDVLKQELHEGRRLNFDEVMKIGLALLEKYDLPTDFVRYKSKR